MDAVNNWDLYAVVRGCSAATTAADPFFSSFPLPREDVDDGEKDHLFPSPDHFETSSILRELQELCKPFDPMESHHPLLSPAAPLLPAVACPSQSQRQPQSQTPRSKRRKNQQKKVVCQVPADGVHSDLWSWRKYGQKPIKGSPYPRGYYRCSSSKGCLARKQVERSRADPGTLLITYTAEHNHPVPTHRNSLSGSTRQKHPPLTPSDGGDGGGYDRFLSPNRPSSSQLPSPDKTQIADSMEDELLLVRRRSWNDEEVELKEEEELLAAGTAYSAEEDEALYLGMDMVSINSGYSDEGGSLEDHIFRSRWLSTIDTAAAAGGR